jgi:hypothetical protein
LYAHVIAATEMVPDSKYLTFCGWCMSVLVVARAGLIASQVARDQMLSFCEKTSSEMEKWGGEEWVKALTSLFATIHAAIREAFVQDKAAEAQNQPKQKRSVDEKGIVRALNGDPIHGGTTVSCSSNLLGCCSSVHLLVDRFACRRALW